MLQTKRASLKVYLAGKVANHQDGVTGPRLKDNYWDWRGDIVDNFENMLMDRTPKGEYADTQLDWSPYPNAIYGRHAYVGPFPHKEAHVPLHKGAHGVTAMKPYGHGMVQEEVRDQVYKLCLKAIDDSDIVFAWITDTTAFGTLYELGYAKAKGKKIWIGMFCPYEHDKYGNHEGHIDHISAYDIGEDFWFAFESVDGYVHAASAGEAFNSIFKENIGPEFTSPIERQFWQAWDHTVPLVPQHPIGPYYADFAHLTSKTVIELDGLATHSSTDDIAKDRKRERHIERLGWYVIRFGGKEVYQNVTACCQEVAAIIRQRS